VLLKLSTPIISLIVLSTILSGCSGNQAAEGLFTPDPQLSTTTTATTATTKPQLPPEFPAVIPVYPQAEIAAIAPNLTPSQGTITWESKDPSNLIQEYYGQELASLGWTLSPETTDNLLLASKDNLDLKIALNSSASSTEIVLNYQPIQSTPPTETTTQPTTVAIADLQQLPLTHQQYIQDLAKLGIFTTKDLGENQTLQPNQIITRREYARWLLEANNRFHKDNPSQQINPINQSSQPAFEDVSSEDPDFPIIQGLAEAGIIPSRLNQNNTSVKFNPDTPLTREDLIAWKVPLDYRKALPTTSIEDIRETWGFQDVTGIDTNTLQALYIDYQNGEVKSNVRRAFGYTTLFQPDKPVTKSEAAAVLWYFGYQNQGISAAEIIQ